MIIAQQAHERDATGGVAVADDEIARYRTGNRGLAQDQGSGINLGHAGVRVGEIRRAIIGHDDGSGANLRQAAAGQRLGDGPVGGQGVACVVHADRGVADQDDRSLPGVVAAHVFERSSAIDACAG